MKRHGRTSAVRLAKQMDMTAFFPFNLETGTLQHPYGLIAREDRKLWTHAAIGTDNRETKNGSLSIGISSPSSAIAST